MDRMIIWSQEVSMEPTWDRPLTDRELESQSLWEESELSEKEEKMWERTYVKSAYGE
jgi:hypothetical protein